jgi:hypothetical protein
LVIDKTVSRLAKNNTMKAILFLLMIISAQLCIAESNLKVHYIETDSGKFGLADEFDHILIRPIYDEAYGWRCKEDAKQVMLKKGDTWFLLDITGAVIIEFADWNPGSSIFRYGLMPVEDKTTGKCGYINEQGEIEIPLEFDNTSSFDVKVPFAPVKQGELFGLLTTDGKWYLEPIYGYFYEIISEDSFIVQIKDKFYLINEKGEIEEEIEMGC